MNCKKIIAAGLSLCLAAPMALTGGADDRSFAENGSDASLGKELLGDINGDGNISTADLVMLQKWLLGTGTLNSRELADVNGDGNIDVFDLASLRKKFMGFMTMYQALTDNYTAQSVTGKDIDDEFILAQTDFSLELMKQSLSYSAENGLENTFISPYSAMQALAMTANGADGETRDGMEKALGGIPIETLDQYLYTLRSSQPNDEGCSLLTANSVWTRDEGDRITVKPEFLRTSVDYFNAEVYNVPFDNSALEAINSWVDRNTKGMIPSILDRINEDAVMYLINAVVFEAEWERPYEHGSAVKYEFRNSDGTTAEIPMLSGEESYYIGDENSSGIFKYYKGRRYAFAALLPDEGITAEDYVNGLTSEKLHDILSTPKYEDIYATIPKFSIDYSITLNDALSDMGMSSAFDSRANFSKMADTASGVLYISAVKHKTHIELDENGTKAAAATSVEMSDNAIMIPEKVIKFDRPFVYAIVDTETSLPVFLGVFTNA